MRFYLLTLVFIICDLCAVKLWLPPPGAVLQNCFDKDVKVIGYIEPLSLKDDGEKASFLIDCAALQCGTKEIEYKKRLRAFIVKDKRSNVKMGKQASKLVPVAAGKVYLTGKLTELHNFTNPGCFDMDNYNRVQELGGSVQVKAIRAEGSRDSFLGFQIGKVKLLDYFALINLRLRDNMARSLHIEGGNNKERGDVAALLEGMVLGGNSKLSDEVRESFSKNGLSHLLSVSGTHLLIISSFLRLLLRKIKKPIIMNIILAAVLCCYACICGLRPPVLRGLGIALLLLWGTSPDANMNKSNKMTCGHSARKVHKDKLLCVLCMCMLIYKPVWILDLGFQLSFAAAAGLILLLPKLQQKLTAYIGDVLGEGLAVSLAAQLAALPVLVANFYTVAPIALISNLLLVPVLELCTILTLTGMLVQVLVPDMPNILVQAAAWLAQQILVQAAWLQSLPYGTVVVGALPAACSCFYYAALFSWLDLGPMLLLNRWQRSLCIWGSLLFIGGCWLWQRSPTDYTKIYFLDVGQGDCAVIISPEQKVAVVDTGGLTGIDTGARLVTPFLQSLGKSKIDLLFVSHSDYDHIGGGAGLARNLVIERIVLPQEKFRKDGFNTINALLKRAAGAKVELAENGRVYDLGGTLLQIVDVPEAGVEGNDASTLLLAVDLKSRHKALFTGDMSVKREAELKELPLCDVLKVGHHGSKTSSSLEFLQSIKPKLAVVSCGWRNKFKHPNDIVLANLDKVGAAVGRTDQQGCIIVHLQEEGIKWRGWRKI